MAAEDKTFTEHRLDHLFQSEFKLKSCLEPVMAGVILLHNHKPRVLTLPYSTKEKILWVFKRDIPSL